MCGETEAHYHVGDNHFGDAVAAHGYDEASAAGSTELEVKASIDGKPVTYISNGAFMNASSKLTGLVIPSGVKRIGKYAFYLSNVTNLEVPSSVTRIGEMAFADCYYLTSVTFKGMPASLSTALFANDTRLAEFHVEDLAALCAYSYNNGGSSSPLITAGHLFVGDEEQTSLAIPASVTTLGKLALAGATAVSKVVLHDGVTSVGDSALAGLAGVDSIVSFATVVPTLGVASLAGLPSTARIYVPYEKVNDYKVASGWSDFADQIAGYYEDQTIENIRYCFNPADVNGCELCGSTSDHYHIGKNLGPTYGGTGYVAGSTLPTTFAPEEKVCGLDVTAVDHAALYHAPFTDIAWTSTLVALGDFAFGDCPLETFVAPAQLKYLGSDFLSHDPASPTGFCAKYIDLSAITATDVITSVNRGSGQFAGVPDNVLIILPADNAVAITDVDNVVYNDEGTWTCATLALTSTGKFISPIDFTATTVSNARSLVTGEDAYTVCLPYAAISDENLTFYTLSEIDGTTIRFTEVEGGVTVPMTPYLVVKKTDDGTLSMTSSTQVEATTGIADRTTLAGATVDGYQMFGTLDEISNADAQGLYILQDGNEWKEVNTANESIKLPAMRAYIKSTGGGKPALNSSFAESSEANRISVIQVVNRNGHHATYDLSGRRINGNSAAAVRIEDGKTIIRRK